MTKIAVWCSMLQCVAVLGSFNNLILCLGNLKWGSKSLSEDGLYYCSKRNNVVVLFGSVEVQSIIRTKVSDWSLLVVFMFTRFAFSGNDSDVCKNIAEYYSVSHCVGCIAVCCSVLQCVAVYCSVCVLLQSQIDRKKDATTFSPNMQPPSLRPRNS